MNRSPVPVSPAFDVLARGAQFRDRIAVVATATPERIFQAVHLVRRSVRASKEDRTRVLPGDERIPNAIGTLTHGVTIRRAPREVWPWLVQMGAGARGGWYSYDWLDNGRQPSATRIIPKLQHPDIGTIFPALPGVTEGFVLLAIEPERVLMLGWPSPAMTWTFLLDEVEPGVTRLLVRARVGPGYRFFGLPLWLAKPVARLVHFVMQRKQLLGIASRVEGQPPARAATPSADDRDAV